MKSLVPIALGLLHVTLALPAITLQDLEVADDTMSVGSYIREVRAAAPQDYHKSYEDGGDGEIGYSRKKSGGGKKGYQHFDSFHKKAGDHYEFEKQDSFGLEDEGQKGAHSHNHEQRERYREQPKKERDIEHINPEYERYVEDELAKIYEAATNEDRPKESKEELKEEQKDEEHSKEHPHYEELKEGADDGNGGVEAYGHEKADYKLPEKYVYGSGEEYNF